METVSARLEAGIERYWEPPEGKRSSIREFSSQMEDRDAPGRARQTIHSYLKGDAEPSLKFLRIAAEVLGVRYPWLATGQGEPTEARPRSLEDARIQEAATGGEETTVEDRFHFQFSVLRGMGFQADTAYYPWMGALGEVGRAFSRSQPVFPLDAPRIGGPELGAALGSVLDALGIDREYMSHDTQNAYAIALMPALMALVPQWEKQQRIADATYIPEEED